MPDLDTTGLTPLQAAVLRFIDGHLRTQGLSPTVEEVRVAFGMKSRSTAHCVLVALRERGRIHWRERLTRSIVLVPDRRAGHVLPPDLQAALEKFCAAHGEEPSAVVADAVAVHLDELDGTANAYGGAL